MWSVANSTNGKVEKTHTYEHKSSQILNGVSVVVMEKLQTDNGIIQQQHYLNISTVEYLYVVNVNTVHHGNNY